MKLRRYAAVFLSIGAIIAVLLTPLGPWSMLRLCTALIEPWTLSVGTIEGSFWSGVTLRDAHLYDEAQGLRLRARTIALSPYDRSLLLQEPHLSLGRSEALPSGHVDTTELILPTAWLPNLQVIDGRLDIELNQSQTLSARGWQSRYRREADRTGSLWSAIDTWEIDGDSLALAGSLAADVTLHPTRLIVDSLRVPIRADSLHAQIRASGTLSLQARRLLEAQYSIRAPGSSNSFSAEGLVTGSLRPLSLQSSPEIRIAHRRLGPLDLQASIDLDTAQVRVDPLHIGGAEGTLSGRIVYALPNDSLWIDLRAERIALSQIDTNLAGRVGGTLRAQFDLTGQRYLAESTLAINDLAWAQGQPFDATLHARHEDDGATLLAFNAAPIRLELRGRSDLSGNYDLQAEGQLIPAALFGLDISPVTLLGTLRPDTLRWTARAAELSILEGATFGPLRAEAALSPSGRGQIDVSIEDDLAIGYGRFDLNGDRADSLSIAVRALPLSRLYPDAEGLLSFDLSAASPWTLNGLDVHIEGHAQDVAYAQWRGGNLTGQARWSGNRGSGQLSAPHARADISVDSAQTLLAHVTLSGPQIRTATEAALVLSGNLSLSGPLQNLRASRAQLALDTLVFQYGRARIASYTPFQVHADEGTATLAPVRLHTSAGPLHLAGMATVDTLSISADWPQIDPQMLVPALSAERGTGHIGLSGTPARPQAAGWIDLRAVSVDTLLLGDVRADWSLRDTLRANAVLRQRGRPAARLDVDWPIVQPDPSSARGRIALRVDTLSLRAPLTYALNRPARGQLSLRSDLSPLLGEGLPLWAPGALLGDIRIDDLSVETHAQSYPVHVKLRPGAQLHARDSGLTLESLDLQIRRYDRNTEAFLPAGTLGLKGLLPTSDTGSAQLLVRDLDLLLFGFTEGHLDVQGQFTGTPSDPHLSVHMDAQTTDLGHIGGTLVGDRVGARWDLQWATPLEDRLAVTGSLPWDPTAGRINWGNGIATAHADSIDLRALSPLLTDVDLLSGYIAGRVQARGLDSTMSLSGQIGFNGVQWALLDVEPAYLLPDGTIDFAGRQGTLNGFSGGKTDAYDAFALSGQLDLASFAAPHFDLSLETRGIDLRYEDLFHADDVDIQLRIDGSARRSRLSGNAVLDAPVAEPVLVILNAPPVPPPPPALRDAFLENMELDVQMELRDLQVDSDLTTAKASGGVGISGTFYKPVFQGDITLDEGKLYLLNRSFDLSQGRIVLNGLVPTRSLLEVAYDPLELNPELDLRAATQVVDRGDADRSYTVTMSLQGPAQSAAPRFESTPALSFNRIVNLLAFGTTNVNDFNYGTALSTAAIRLLSKRVEKVGLDEFAVLPSSSIMGVEQGEPALRMGKFVDIPFAMWVRYEAAISNMSQGEVRIEHRLNSIFTVTGSAQSEYDRYGLGVGLQKEF